MSDYLVDLGANPNARKVIKSLGLPIPMPQKLERSRGPWEERPLQDRDVLVGATAGADLGDAIAATLAAAGANPFVVGDIDEATPFAGPGEAYGRPPLVVPRGEATDAASPYAMIFDASGLDTPADTRAAYDFFHPWIRRLRRCGRIVVVGRPPESQRSAEEAATQAALEGFVRSLAKEVGRRGAVANLAYVARGAEDRLPAVLRFLVSPRAAFVSGQPWRVTKMTRSLEDARTILPLEGKVALVTGAARGIGRETARLLAGEGAHVVVLDRPADDGPASRVARDIGGSALLVDITDADAPQRIAASFMEEHGGVDIVVHNAGVTRDKTLANMSPDRWDMTLDVNLGAVSRITDALLAGPLRDGGRIVCLSSIAGIAGNMGQTNYSASKAGIIGYVRTLAPSVAKRGITVNAIAPGFIETRLTDAVPPVIREAARRMSNLSQGGLPQDIAEVVTFLASPGAVGVSGEVLRVCGGHLTGA